MLTGRRDGIGASLPRWIMIAFATVTLVIINNVAAVVREFFVTKENPMMQSWRHSADSMNMDTARVSVHTGCRPCRLAGCLQSFATL